MISWKLAGVLCTIGVIASGTVFWLRTRLPPLVRDLPGPFAGGSIEFQKRVHEQFPAGSSEDQVVKELKAQGFEIILSGPPVARLEQGMLFCKRVWIVTWESDTLGLLVQSEGSYDMFCL